MSRGGASPRRKGCLAEREIAKLLNGERVPLSGAAGGSFGSDLIVPGLGKGEVKRRKKQFTRLYQWLEEKDFLALRDDRQPWLVVMTAEKLMKILEGGKGSEGKENTQHSAFLPAPAQSGRA